MATASLAIEGIEVDVKMQMKKGIQDDAAVRMRI